MLANNMVVIILQYRSVSHICVWIYLWAFYFVPLIYMSVFVPVPYCLDCGFVVEPEVRQVDSSSSLSVTKEARIYNGVKTISLTSGAGKSGQPLVKE